MSKFLYSNLLQLTTFTDVIVEYVHFVSREKTRVTNGNGYETGLDPNEVNVKTEALKFLTHACRGGCRCFLILLAL
jgi:23S rRNA G2069 N7-methylase RlmK/C1962 C5-methylase RlmI